MATFTLLESVRLTGRTSNSDIDLVTLRDKAEVAEPLDVKSDVLPVRVEIHDFVDDTGEQWIFEQQGIWQRGAGGFAWTEFSSYKDGDAYDEIDLLAHGQESQADKPKKLYIKIKPVVDAPDPT